MHLCPTVFGQPNNPVNYHHGPLSFIDVLTCQTENQPLDLAFSLESVRDFVSEKAIDLRAAFDFEPSKARQILANYVEKAGLDCEGCGRWPCL